MGDISIKEVQFLSTTDEQTVVDVTVKGLDYPVDLFPNGIKFVLSFTIHRDSKRFVNFLSCSQFSIHKITSGKNDLLETSEEVNELEGTMLGYYNNLFEVTLHTKEKVKHDLNEEVKLERVVNKVSEDFKEEKVNSLTIELDMPRDRNIELEFTYHSGWGLDGFQKDSQWSLDTEKIRDNNNAVFYNEGMVRAIRTILHNLNNYGSLWYKKNPVEKVIDQDDYDTI